MSEYLLNNVWFRLFDILYQILVNSLASEDNSVFSSDTLNLHLNKAILSLRQGELIFLFFFLENKRLLREKQFTTDKSFTLKLPMVKKKQKKNEFSTGITQYSNFPYRCS